VADTAVTEQVTSEKPETPAVPAASSPATVEAQSLELAVRSFQAFCDDLGSMFGMAISCEHKGTRRCTLADLKNSLGRLVAVNPVKSTGAMNGQFPLVFDKKGVFTLAGVIVMLPEERIGHLCRSGDANDATEMADAIREAGNLLVGSWDRVFREDMVEHGHFTRGDVFIGDAWTESEKNLGIKTGQEISCVTCSIRVEPFAPFTCVALFPGEVFIKPVVEPEKPAAQPVSAEAVSQPQSSAGNSNVRPDVAPASAIAASPAVVAADITGIQRVTAGDLMVTDVIWVEEDATVGSVFEKMESRSAAYAVIGKDGHASGIVSRYDLAGAISPYLNPLFARWRRVQDDATLDIKVKWIMSKPARMVSTTTPACAAAARMLQWRVGCLPVADDSGEVKGILTRYELISLLVANS
jgi:CBS domain-containing protein